MTFFFSIFLVLICWSILFKEVAEPASEEYKAKRAARDKSEQVAAVIGGICVLLAFVALSVFVLYGGWQFSFGEWGRTFMKVG